MAQVSFRIDDQLKTDADRLFRSMGMNMSVAITIFFQQSVQRGKLPFEVLGDPFFGESNTRKLERRARDMDAGRTARCSSRRTDAPLRISSMSKISTN